MSAVGSRELLVVGGGAIGLTIAWRARQQGMDVAVLERGTLGGGTSRVAAGMLAPVAEVEFGAAGTRALTLGMRSAEMWPAFAAELAEAGGVEVGLRRTGTLMLARDEDEARELDRQLAFRQSLGLDVRRLRASAARRAEPALAPTLRLALEAPDDHSVDPRLLLAALERACREAGVELREHAAVAALDCDGEAVSALRLADGERLSCETVVVAAGAWSGELGGLPAGAAMPVRPVKGQIVRLRDPDGPGLLERVVRYSGGYVVPRGDGRYVLGATVEERGFRMGATAGAVYELLRDAHELLPGIGELEIEELSVGMRPGSPDNVPMLGVGARHGLVWATGHYRNGILLAPLSALLVLDVLLGGGQEEELLSLCDPQRFAAERTSREVAA